MSGNFGGIFLLSFVLLGLFSSFLLELLEFVDLLFNLVCLLVGLMLGMRGSLSSLFLDLGGLDLSRLFVAILLLVFLGLLFLGLLLHDLLLSLVLCLLDGVNLRVFSMDKLIVLGLCSLLSLCLSGLSCLLLTLELLDASVHFFVMLILDLFVVGSLFLASGISLLIMVVSLVILLLLGDSFSGLLVGTAAATELLADMLDDGVVVAG